MNSFEDNFVKREHQNDRYIYFVSRLDDVEEDTRLVPLYSSVVSLRSVDSFAEIEPSGWSQPYLPRDTSENTSRAKCACFICENCLNPPCLVYYMKNKSKSPIERQYQRSSREELEMISSASIRRPSRNAKRYSLVRYRRQQSRWILNRLKNVLALQPRESLARWREMKSSACKVREGEISSCQRRIIFQDTPKTLVLDRIHSRRSFSRVFFKRFALR